MLSVSITSLLQVHMVELSYMEVEKPGIVSCMSLFCVNLAPWMLGIREIAICFSDYL